MPKIQGGIFIMNIYTEIILDLKKNPHNKGEIKNPTHEFRMNNPLCGDEMKMQLVVKNNKIDDVKFSGQGCAISQASASLLTDKIKGEYIKSVKIINREDILGLLHIPISPGRMRCAMLCLEALRGALKR